MAGLPVLPAALAGAALLLAGCGPVTPESKDPPGGGQSVDQAHGATAVEQPAAVTRLSMTYDGGILVVDADTLSVIADIPLEGFNRISDSGDGRHVAVSTAGKFQLLDLGTWAQGHGEHFHYFTDTPTLTEIAYSAESPGHVVANGGHTIFFDDATGVAQIVPTAEVAEAGVSPEVYRSRAAHHGVAVALDDGTLLVTDGESDSRSGLLAFDPERKKIAETQDCEGIHGEAVAAHQVAVFGCADGVVAYHDGKIEKIDSPDAGRGISTLVGARDSAVLLGNYSAEGDALPTEVTLIDTEAEKITVVDLGATYSFRSLALGDEGEALVLTTDGSLRVLDPSSGSETGAYPVLSAWEVPEDWQVPRPAIFAVDGNAYVTDPATRALYAVDIATGEVWNQAVLPRAINEITGVTGYPTSGAVEEDHDHDHEG